MHTDARDRPIKRKDIVNKGSYLLTYKLSKAEHVEVATGIDASLLKQDF